MTIRAKSAAAFVIAGATVALAQPATAATNDAKTPSIFLQCDGRIGHVDGGERFLRLLLVSATAGLSETGMSSDDAGKRSKGAAGVAACDSAIAKEGDAYRRVQLGLARAIHFAEDHKWQEAAEAARNAPSLSTKLDWGLTKSSTSAARYLEALFLIRAGNVEAGEAAAWDGVRAAGGDVLTMQRMLRYVGLSRTLTPEKRSALRTMLRYYPLSAISAAEEFAAAGDFDAASSALRGLDLSLQALSKKPENIGTFHSALASFAAMKGDLDTARAEIALARSGLEEDRVKGEPASNPSAFGVQEEALAFAEATVTFASGDASAAAQMLGSRGSWPTISPGRVARLVGLVAAKIPEKDRRGIVAKGEEGVWKEARDARLALLKNSEKDDKLWLNTAILAQDVGYERIARQVLSGSTKPKWLLKPGKEPSNLDIIAAFGATGWEVGEGILYHAALIAKARGKQGFILAPKRDRLDIAGVKFVNVGEFGIPAEAIVPADEVIASLSPHIREAARN